MNAIGWTTSGSAAYTVARNPSGSVIALAASSGERPAYFTTSTGGGGVSAFSSSGLAS